MEIKKGSIIFLADKEHNRYGYASVIEIVMNIYLGENFFDLSINYEDNIFLYGYELIGDMLFLNEVDFLNYISYIIHITIIEDIRINVTPDFLEANNRININCTTIKDFIRQRNIEYLYHFTNSNNLNSILQYGIIPIQELNKLKMDYHYNDEIRLDGKINCNSLTFSFPNTDYLINLKNNYPNNEYCILEIDSSIIYEYGRTTYFCKYNAARTDAKALRSTDVNGLKRMFDYEYYNSNPDTYYRYYGIEKSVSSREKWLPLNFPSQSQAEVLVSGIIPINKIISIIFESEINPSNYEKICNNNNINIKIDDRFFKRRSRSIIEGIYYG